MPIIAGGRVLNLPRYLIPGPNSATRATSQSEFGKPQRDDQIAQRDFSEVILPTGASNTPAVYVQTNNASVHSLLQHVTASCGTGSEPLQAALEG